MRFTAPRARPTPPSLDAASAWIDANVRRLGSEDAPVPKLGGRVLTADVIAAVDEPSHPRAADDGFAVRADETVGASAYNPLSFRVVPTGVDLPPGGVVRLDAGDALPDGADAVAPLDYVHAGMADRREIIDAVVRGRDVVTPRSEFARGAVLYSAGHRLSAADVGLLALAGVTHAIVARQPRIGLVLASRGLNGPDADGPMLRLLIERDGGDVVSVRRADGSALRQALAAADLDAVIVAGGTGHGVRDDSVAALAELGEVVTRDVALHPGGTAALGRTRSGAVAVLLPGRPAACLWSYELIAGRAIRRLAGRDPGLPFVMRTLTLTRKIVSTIGVTDVFPVQRTGADRAEPISAFARDSLRAWSQADGFVVVPEGSEGFASDAAAPVYLLRAAPP